MKDECGKVFQDEIYINAETPPIIIVYPPECSEGKCDDTKIITPEVVCTGNTCIPVISNLTCTV
jgi:hypothetical protein